MTDWNLRTAHTQEQYHEAWSSHIKELIHLVMAADIPFQKWKTISLQAGLSAPEIFNERISRYRQGTIYAAINYLKP